MLSPPVWPQADKRQFVDELLTWLEHAGAEHADEDISQLDHALQAADQARRAGDDASAIVAALLHDIGHLLTEHQSGLDDEDHQHEKVAEQWLGRMFPASVTQPIREHVRAKRYLCTVDEHYGNRLSVGSTHSLALQGGALNAAERRAFEALPHFEAALRLRKRDEAAKVPDKPVPTIDSYRDVVLSMLQ